MLAQNNQLTSRITVSKLYERANTSAREDKSNDLLKKGEVEDFSDEETLSTCSGATSRGSFRTSNDHSFTAKYDGDI